jgi:hypothetical protein
MKVEVVLKDVGVEENGAKDNVIQEYVFACSRTKLWRRYL